MSTTRWESGDGLELAAPWGREASGHAATDGSHHTRPQLREGRLLRQRWTGPVSVRGGADPGQWRRGGADPGHWRRDGTENRASVGGAV